MLGCDFWNTANFDLKTARVQTGSKYVDSRDGTKLLVLRIALSGNLNDLIDELKRELFAENLVLWEKTGGKLKKYNVFWTNSDSAFEFREHFTIDYTEIELKLEVLDSYSWDSKMSSQAVFGVTDKIVHSEVVNSGTAPTDPILWMSISEAQNCTKIQWSLEEELVEISGNYNAGDIIEFDSLNNEIKVNSVPVEDYNGVMPDKLKPGKNYLKVEFAADSIKSDILWKFTLRGR